MSIEISTKDSFDRVSSFARISDWDLETAQELGHFKISDIPHNARVLNVGSGYSQVFEKQLKATRPDIQIVSVDPSTAMLDYKVVLNGSSSWDGKWRVKTRTQLEERIATLNNKENTVAALGQELPFADGSFHFGIDIYGAAKYARDIDSYKRYLREIKRTVNGQFYIAEVFGGTIINNKPNEQIQSAQNIFNELGIKANLFVDKMGGTNQLKIGAVLNL